MKKQVQKPAPMREAESTEEGLLVDTVAESGTTDQTNTPEWDSFASVEQIQRQQGVLSNEAFPLLTEDLRPTAVKLRSRRSKRCQTCRYHLLRPDDKRHSTRYKLRLLALNFVPRISATALDSGKQSDILGAEQFVITCRNPLYDPVRVKLGTPTHLHGQDDSRVTILCPEFEIGASREMWDEALEAGKGDAGTGGGAGDRGDGKGAHAAPAHSRGAPEAGKVWSRGRNWTAVVLELVRRRGSAAEGAAVEVPVFVRMEYTTDAATSVGSIESPETSPGYRSAREEPGKVHQELGFWVVLAVA